MSDQPQEHDATMDNFILRWWTTLKQGFGGRLLKMLIESLPAVLTALKPEISKLIASFPLRLWGVNVVVVVIAIQSCIVCLLWELLSLWRGLQQIVVVSISTRELQERLRPSLVLYRFSTPSRTFGTGLVLHHSSFTGLVLIDKCKVTLKAELRLSFSRSRQNIAGEVVYVDNEQNFALVAYDPALLGQDSGVVSAELTDAPALHKRDFVSLVRLNRLTLEPIVRRYTIIDPCSCLSFSSRIHPYTAIRTRSDFRQMIETEVKVIELDRDPRFSGVLVDVMGRVRALLGSFHTQGYRGTPLSTTSLPRRIKMILSTAEDIDDDMELHGD